MILHQNPLRTVAELHRSAALDVDMQQSNRYCIRLNTPNGKEGYYFASPIYNAYSRKLVWRLFLQSGFEFRFCGSNCSVTVTGTLEESVSVNHSGSVITLDPIDLGEDGYIPLTEETEPNFLGVTATFEDFLDRTEPSNGFNLTMG